VDEDGDGYAPTDCGGDDCDDTDEDIYPGAVEDCEDKVDNDCDGDVDADDEDCAGDDDTGDDDTGDDDTGDDDTSDDDTGDDDTDEPVDDDDTGGTSDCECESNVGGTIPAAPLGLVGLLVLAAVRRRLLR